MLNNLPFKIISRNPVLILAVLGIVLMFYGFLFSRVVSNIGFLFIGIFALIKINKISWLWKDPWMITFLWMALIHFSSDICYGGTDFLGERGIMKLLLILFPAFVFALNAGKKMTGFVNCSFILFMLGSSLYSLYHYGLDFAIINDGYKISKVMPVLSFKDHIRISWAVVISCILAFYELKMAKISIYKGGLISYIIFQIIFLHLLGSKTGLVMLYLSVGIAIFYTLPEFRKRWLFIILPVLLLTPFVAYKTIPSLQQRVKFIKYDFEFYSKGEYKEGLSDAVRFYSLQAGKDIIMKHPIAGVGFNNLHAEMAHWYQKHLPEMKEENYFLPSSEIIIYWASAGILGLFIILIHIILPFFMVNLRKNLWFMTFFIPASLSFTYETPLEGQLPLFIYGFFIAWFWYLATNKTELHSLNIKSNQKLSA